MTENNKDTKAQNNAQIPSGHDKPWYKKKNTIIASSSILGAGVLATVIAVPIALTNTSTNNVVLNEKVLETINLLNTPNNKVSRFNVWNAYATKLDTPITSTGNDSPYSKILFEEPFINQFINLLTNNLYISEVNTDIGSVTQEDANKIENTLISSRIKPLFKNTANVNYVKLFNFEQDAPMFRFSDSAIDEKIAFELYMPLAGLDITYNNDLSVSMKVENSTTNPNNNIRLVISKFDSPLITSPKNIYFKNSSIIKLPSTIMGGFSSFFDDSIKKELTSRTELEKKYQALKVNIEKSQINGLSYWNSFALNFAESNVSFLKNDFAKELESSSFYNFLKDTLLPILPNEDLMEIKTQLAIDLTNGLNKTPFVESPTYSNLLFNTSNTNGNKYSLEFNISKFSYEYKINNLFNGPSAITISPLLTLDGVLTKTPNDVNQTSSRLLIKKDTYNFSNLINMTSLSLPAVGGLPGFLDTLINIPNDPLATLTNGLANFNGQMDTNKIKIWNGFNNNTSVKPLILTELRKPNVLYDFVIANTDLVNNTYGMGGAFPVIDFAIFKTNFNAAALNIDSSNLSFLIPGVAAINLNDIIWGSMPNNKFTSISIYFGYEVNAISEINLTSTINGASMSLSQTAGEAFGLLTTLDLIKTAASKRLSIVFESNANLNHIAYFGQKKVMIDGNDTQVTTPIIIPSTILTSATKFIELLNNLKL